MRYRSRTLAVVACIGMALVITASPARALSSVEACFYNSLNNERVAVGRPKLVLKGDLVATARNHSKEMAADETIYHNDNLKNEVDGNWWALGENVGMGPTCDSIHQAFMDSPGHKANILDKDYNQIGVGVVVKDDTIYVTEVFAGRPSGSSSPPKKAPSQLQPKPKPKPKPIPIRPTTQARTVPMLLILLGMDAVRVDPSSGAALGV